jgi:hypothetical protein
MKIILTILLFNNILFSQINDFFPLSVGFSWTYNYTTFSADYLNGFYASDSGIAVYSIISNAVSNDSTVWEFREIRDIIHRFGTFFPPHTSGTDTIQDTTNFFIVEYYSGNHRLIRTEQQDLFSVLPLFEEFQDSVLFFRYFPNIVQDTFSVNINSDVEPYESYSISFKRNVGITETSFYLGPLVGYEASTNHTLKDFTTSVQNSYSDLLPDGYKLEQNYPNPFNPFTKIKYSIPQSGIVQIKVYDILGNEVAALVDEFKPAGNYETEFSPLAELASGVYFYRISSNTFSETKKMIFLR